MQLEDAHADINCLQEERGAEALLDRYGITCEDIEYLSVIAHDDLRKTTILLHGLLVGLSLAELRRNK